MHRPFPIILCAALLRCRARAAGLGQELQAVRSAVPSGCARVAKGEL